jgi:hypothetical protein
VGAEGTAGVVARGTGGASAHGSASQPATGPAAADHAGEAKPQTGGTAGACPGAATPACPPAATTGRGSVAGGVATGVRGYVADQLGRSERLQLMEWLWKEVSWHSQSMSLRVTVPRRGSVSSTRTDGSGVGNSKKRGRSEDLTASGGSGLEGELGQVSAQERVGVVPWSDGLDMDDPSLQDEDEDGEQEGMGGPRVVAVNEGVLEEETNVGSTVVQLGCALLTSLAARVESDALSACVADADMHRVLRALSPNLLPPPQLSPSQRRGGGRGSLARRLRALHTPADACKRRLGACLADLLSRSAALASRVQALCLSIVRSALPQRGPAGDLAAVSNPRAFEGYEFIFSVLVASVQAVQAVQSTPSPAVNAARTMLDCLKLCSDLAGAKWSQLSPCLRGVSLEAHSVPTPSAASAAVSGTAASAADSRAGSGASAPSLPTPGPGPRSASESLAAAAATATATATPATSASAAPAAPAAVVFPPLVRVVEVSPSRALQTYATGCLRVLVAALSGLILEDTYSKRMCEVRLAACAAN